MRDRILIICIFCTSFTLSFVSFFYNPKIYTNIDQSKYLNNFMNKSNFFDYRHWYILFKNENDIEKKEYYFENATALLKYNSSLKDKLLFEKLKIK